MASDLQSTIRKHALANAVKFNGKASLGNIIGKIISEHPDAKNDMKSFSQMVSKVVTEINTLSIDFQEKELQEKFPEMLIKKEQEERNLFAFFNIKDGQKVRSAFPPGPEKYPHIGHAKAAILNYMLAKQYNGSFTLRFEDTNPNLVQEIFYDILVENLKWLGVSWDETVYASDHMELFYQYAEDCITRDNAYMCFCHDEELKNTRGKSVACKCRSHSIESNLKFWKEFPAYPEGKAILRLKIDLEHENTTMRDPTIFRVIDTPHARHQKKYRVWPNYDFQNAIMDGYFKITHRVRSKEFEMRSVLQKYIQTILGLENTETYEFARFNLVGVESSGRVIRTKVMAGEYLGWDDPRLTTIVALRRRGFMPDAIKNFVISTGMTKSESTLTWDDLIVQNKKIVDKTAKRFFFIHDFESIAMNNAPNQTISLHLHPDQEGGNRVFEVNEKFLVQKSDLKECKEGELYRLMDCLNFKMQGKNYVFESKEYGHFKGKGKKTMHFLPDNASNVPVEIMMPDTKVLVGLGEKTLSILNVGEVIQFERFGFCRLDAKENGIYKFWFTHN